MNPSEYKICRELWKQKRVMSYLLKAARLHAWHQRVPYDDIEDCAVEFAETMLLKQGKALRNQLQDDHFEAWVNRCAHNHVADFRRRWRSVHKHETQWPFHAQAEGASKVQEAECQEAATDARLLRGEVGQRLQRAAQCLAPIPRALFLRHFLKDETLPELAAMTGRSPDAIGKVCKRACGSIHAALLRQGMTDEDAQEYLNILDRKSGGGDKKCHLLAEMAQVCHEAESRKNYPSVFGSHFRSLCRGM